MIKKAARISSILLLLALFFSACTPAPKEAIRISYRNFLTLEATLPHNQNSFTQGLFIHNGKMYESTGLYGESSVFKNINPYRGIPESSYKFENDVFAEGSVIFKNKLYVLSWKENRVFVFNPDTLLLEKELPHNREGWGLTTDGNYLIASDGSSKLYYMDEELNDIKILTVTVDSKETANLNELEFIEGRIWANVWLTNEVLIINPESGEAGVVIDFSGLHDANSADSDDVLNGIAYNPNTKKIYITGKRWNSLYEFKIK